MNKTIKQRIADRREFPKEIPTPEEFAELARVKERYKIITRTLGKSYEVYAKCYLAPEFEKAGEPIMDENIVNMTLPPEVIRNIQEVLGDSEPEKKMDVGELDITDAALGLAIKHDIDVALIEGTGADGRILKSDVESLIGE